jgi:DNA-binding MarR family transcriptional regulator
MAKSRGDEHDTLEPDEWESWEAVTMLNRLVLQDLDVELHREHQLAITEFDALVALYNVSEKRLRMSVLADLVMLSPAGTTHLVTRLERDGMVRREVDPTDRRKWFTVLTDAGDQALHRARRTHSAVLRRTILAVASPAELRTLRRLSERLAQQHLTPINPSG